MAWRGAHGQAASDMCPGRQDSDDARARFALSSALLCGHAALIAPHCTIDAQCDDQWKMWTALVLMKKKCII